MENQFSWQLQLQMLYQQQQQQQAQQQLLLSHVSTPQVAPPPAQFELSLSTYKIFKHKKFQVLQRILCYFVDNVVDVPHFGPTMAPYYGVLLR